ncbi:MAG: flagellin [Burkholderiales bacterium]|uniref:flagellin N-terminal helical domain-containing protein n=1 Tax=Roseateles sp. TaxID=1971397 RepID=UPI000F9AF65C|nr:MAG: flagellin [Burkholderiales bacterium]
MAQTINTNLASLTAQLNLSTTQRDLQTAITRLSSGLRINSAKDDAAGLAISERFTSQISGLSQAARNANDGISLAQVAEGGLGSLSANLQRIRQLAVQSANATNSPSDRAALQQEVIQLQQEIDRVATQTQFNGLNLLDGTFTAQQFQVGANAGQTITVAGVPSVRASALGVYQGFALTSQAIGTASNTAVAFSVTAGSTTYSLGNVAVDAKAQANAIQSANVPGLTATANPTVVAAGASAASATAPGTANLTINGVLIPVAGVNGGAALASNRANLVSVVNANSAATGVTARDTGGGVQFTAADGRNVTIAYAAGTFTGSNAQDFGIAAGAIATTGGTINVTYVAPTGVTGTVTFTQANGLGSATSGITAPVAIASTGTAISAVDISTVAGANSALSAIDAALATVNGNRATLGAVQNRFSQTIQNLQTAGENLSASRSRIQDADFAAETAALSRAQVLQQAGTAMVAQANQLPQQVLQLLRNG